MNNFENRSFQEAKPEDKIPKKGESKIPEKELEERINRLKTMGKVIGEDFDMNVTIGTQPGWRYIFKPENRIEVDPNDIVEKSDLYCLGVIAHEGSHRKISRVDFIPRDVWQETGFSFLMNAVEDPRVNNWVSEKYDGAAEWIQHLYNQDISDEEKIESAAKKKLGYTPKHIKFGLEVIRKWHTGSYSKDLPKNIAKILKETEEYAKIAYETLPDTNDPSEDDILEKAKDTYKIVYGGIWPKYQELVDEAFEDEKMRQMIKEMMEQGDITLPENEMSEKDDAESEKKEKMSGEEKDKKGGKKGKSKEEKGKDEKESSDDSKGEGKEQEGEGEQQNGEGEGKEGKSDAGEDKESGGGIGEPKPFDEMSEEMREKIKQALKEKLEGMTPKERKEFEEKAEEKAEDNLDELESKLNKELKGKFSEQPESSHDKKKRGKEEIKSKEEIKKAKDEIEQMLEAGKTEYDKTYEEVAPFIQKVSEDIINLFAHQRFPKFKPKFPGQKLRLKGAMDYESKKDYKKLFEQRQPSERESYDFLLLVDLSGSMEGDTIEETFKGVVLLAEALERAGAIMGGVRVSIYGFQDVLIPYKDFDERINDVLRDKMSVMKEEVSDEGIHNESRWNSDGYCVWKASDILEKTNAKNKFLWVLSDGKPVADNHRVPKYEDIDDEEELRSVVKDISSNTKQHVLGIGLGKGTDHVSDFYSNKIPRVENIPGVKIQELSETIAEKVRKTIVY